MDAREPAAAGLQSTFADTWNIPLRREPDADIVVNQVWTDLFPKCSLIFSGVRAREAHALALLRRSLENLQVSQRNRAFFEKRGRGGKNNA